MTMWLIRAGGTGEREQVALDNSVAPVGWEDLPDLAACTTREQVLAMLRAVYPTEKPRTHTSWQHQLWLVRDAIQDGDLVALPLKARAAIAFGVVTGGYAHRSDLPGGPFHTRPVEWLAQIPRSAFDPDVLFSFGAFMTVCRVERNDAERRVRLMLAQQAWPGPSARLRPQPHLRVAPVAQPMSIADFEERSDAMIRDRITQKFKGHRLAALVAAVLDVQGLQTRVAPPGPDGGVDILAGSGPLGFDTPRLAVQVKSQDAKVDVRVLREMAGAMLRFKADHGLLVAWGGFNQSVRSEGASEYFRIRLWDAADVVRAVQDCYARLPPDIRADIPLKQVWALVPQGQDQAGRPFAHTPSTDHARPAPSLRMAAIG